jgi:hypothetical protein
MAAKQSTAPASSPSSGPRQKLRIRVAYTGKGPPGEQLRERCSRLEDMLVEEGAGVLGPGAVGDGAVDIYITTRDVERTKAAAWKIVNDLGLSSRTTIKIADGKVES